MPRAARIEYPDAVYHVTTRGNRRDAIFEDDRDRERLLAVMASAFARCEARALAYCLMPNHYHVVLHTRHANLSEVMRHVNGAFTHAFNRRHGRSGHLFQGRFASVHVDREAHLLSACRYVDLNPVRAGLLWDPARWPWSSFRAHAGLASPPAWLDCAALQERFLGRPVRDEADVRMSGRSYAKWVEDGRNERLWDVALREGRFLGDEAFVEWVKGKA